VGVTARPLWCHREERKEVWAIRKTKGQTAGLLVEALLKHLKVP